MMVYFKAWIFCSLCLLFTGQSECGMTNRDSPYVSPDDGYLHLNLSYSIACVEPPHIDYEAIHTYTFWVDQVLTAITPENSFMLVFNSSLEGKAVKCRYETDNLTATSGDFILTSDPYPVPGYVLANPSAIVVESQPTQIICSVPIYLRWRLTGYSFTMVNPRTSFTYEASSRTRVVYPSQVEFRNYTCQYVIGDFVSNVSNVVTLKGTIITSVTTTTSSSVGFSGQDVRFDCVVVTHPDSTPPSTTMDTFTYDWYDGDGMELPAQQSVSFNKSASWQYTLTSNLTRTCEVSANNEIIVPSAAPATITLRAFTAPVIVATPTRSIFLSGGNYSFNCTSEFAAEATRYSFNFINDPSLSSNQSEPIVDLGVDVSDPPQFTCVVHAGLASSDESPPFLVNVVEIPKPSIPRVMHYFTGNTYVLECQTQPIGNEIYTGYIWSINGTTDGEVASNRRSFILPATPYSLTISCFSLIGSVMSVESDAVTVNVEEIPQPTISVSPDLGIYINGSDYTFTCDSAIPGIATEYSFVFLYHPQLSGDQASPSITLTADDAEMYQFTCSISNFNSSSPTSVRTHIVPIVPSPPTIQLLNVPSHYIVGSEYALECQSDLEAHVVQYCLQDSNIQMQTCQSSKTFNFTVAPTELLLQCNAGFTGPTTDFGQTVSIIGSGIIDTTASADNLAPYPGTNVTLTCSANLVSGYDESDVTFSWKEGATLIGQSKITSEYVTNDMVRSFQCEGTTGQDVNVISDALTVTARDLPTPSIEVQNRPADDDYEPGHFYPLICNSELEDLLTSYNWYKDGQLVADVHTKRYLAQAMSYTHTYTCTFVVVTEESPQGGNLTIATQSILSVHVENNGLRATSLMPVFDSTLMLSCETVVKSTATESPTYSWFERGVQVGSGPELTVVAYTGYDNPIVCVVTVGDDVMNSNEVNITAKEDLSSPEISLITHQANQILPRASYTLRCFSNSLSLNTSITWYKDMSELSCLRDLTLYITRYDPLIHDGQYTCEIATFGMTARSVATAMLGIAPGKQCTGLAQCSGQGEGYTGQCQDQRCVCSSGYKARIYACVLV